MIVKIIVKFALFLTIVNFISAIVNAKLEVRPERAILAYYNQTTGKDVKFTYRKINRTTFAMSSSYTMLRDIPDNDIMVHLSVDRKAGNEYKSMGLSMKFNLCDFYRSNTYGIAEDIGKYGNFTACNIKKGYYYVKDYIPDLSHLPALIPGSFKLYVRVTHHSADFFEIHWYVTIVETITW